MCFASFLFKNALKLNIPSTNSFLMSTTNRLSRLHPSPTRNRKKVGTLKREPIKIDVFGRFCGHERRAAFQTKQRGSAFNESSRRSTASRLSPLAVAVLYSTLICHFCERLFASDSAHFFRLQNQKNRFQTAFITQIALSTMVPSNHITIGSSSSSLPRGFQERRCRPQKEEEEEQVPEFKSQSIPICKNLNRTPSELQLCMDEELAEERDYAFFARLVNGIGNSGCTSRYLQMENQNCLAHIIQTRHERLVPASSSLSANEPTFSLDEQIMLAQQQQTNDDQWSLGLADMEQPVDNYNNHYHHHHHHAISTESSLQPTEDDDDGAIFDLDL